MRYRLAALAVLAAAVFAGCGSSPPNATTSASRATTSSSSAAPSTVSGHLTVFAAASLTGAFTTAEAPLTAANPGLSIAFNFGGSNTLVSQIVQGAPADVFASADQKNMQRLVQAGLVDTPVVFARNQLEIAVAAGNPKHITGLADLGRADVAVVLGAPGVPAGDYARQVLARQHINVTPRSLETDVKSALAKIASGEADATVVYVTDVRAAGPSVTGVTIPSALQPDIAYPIAVVKATKNRAAAEAFVRSARSGEVARQLDAAGFLSAS